jgi:O-antigen ligase
VSAEGLTLRFPLPPLAAAIAAQIDGQRSLGNIHAAISAKAGPLDWAAFSRQFALLYAALPGLQQRISHTGPRDNNVRERVALYQVAVWEIGTRPLTGFGPGQGIRQKQFFERLPEKQRTVQRHPHLHSFHLNLAADMGLTGTVLFTGILIVLLLGLKKVSVVSSGFERMLATGLIWGFAGVLIGDCFDTLLRGPGVAMELFWLAGLALGGTDTNNDGGNDVH